MEGEDEDEALTEKNPRLNDLTEQDFLDWKHHPVTILLRQYMDDYGRMLRRLQEEGWLNSGAGVPVDRIIAAEMKGRIRTLAELYELKFPEIATFYQSVQEETNAAETDQDESGGL